MIDLRCVKNSYSCEEIDNLYFISSEFNITRALIKVISRPDVYETYENWDNRSSRGTRGSKNQDREMQLTINQGGLLDNLANVYTSAVRLAIRCCPDTGIIETFLSTVSDGFSILQLLLST